jgi:hypothetical protein
MAVDAITIALSSRRCLNNDALQINLSDSVIFFLNPINAKVNQWRSMSFHKYPLSMQMT